MWCGWLCVAVAATLGSGLPAADTAIVTAAHGEQVCTVTDPRLNEISGMVRRDDGYVMVDDGSDLSSHWRIFFLNERCAVTRTVPYPSRPRDTEDLAAGRDGTIWVADIGDNNRTRQTVALWRLASGSHTPVLYRLSYPDGAHDAEALVVAGDGTPVIVTKDPGQARLYQPAAALRPGATVALRNVGAFDLPASHTSNPFSFAGHLVVTGGADSPDGSRVVLRTYADAFEFPVTGGDVVRAITMGRPRVIPLPDEPQGESIAYDRDGVSLLTVSEQTGAAKPVILRYPRTPDRPSATPRPGRSSTPPHPGADSEASPQDGSAGVAVDAAARHGPTALVAGVAGLAALGLGMVVVVGILRRR